MGSTIVGVIIGDVGDFIGQSLISQGRQEYLQGDAILNEGVSGWCQASGKCNPGYGQRIGS